ncbi:unnamed protein product [Toxocara canis]|uniref:Late endosomal/lysosomal adaptor and MAPK and MTOR activator 1 n=1 Tax=Toxocara canis TaxID=6265 RepID=A0A183TWH3_TOXCA|nr:unnamed protein product [Toxocara canis]
MVTRRQGRTKDERKSAREEEKGIVDGLRNRAGKVLNEIEMEVDVAVEEIQTDLDIIIQHWSSRPIGSSGEGKPVEAYSQMNVNNPWARVRSERSSGRQPPSTVSFPRNQTPVYVKPLDQAAMMSHMLQLQKHT